MGLDFELVDGQTPLDEEEKEGLLIPTITTRGELDEFEQRNIEKAIQWTLIRKFKKDDILTEDFIKLVHKKMYGDVWAWAGEFRKTNKNIGMDRYQVAIELRSLIGDCNYWIDHGTYPPDEIAVRFKHRIVSIHCFSNGNGRHSRMMGDLLIEKVFNQPVFTWGATIYLLKSGDTRREYLSAIKTADACDINP
ncbi:MAG: mobile mystery protein B [Cyclobacteriaceae bacterium]|nr:mobile mystery protein B [Cyclobacteriaceae bacterium]